MSSSSSDNESGPDREVLPVVYVPALDDEQSEPEPELEQKVESRLRSMELATEEELAAANEAMDVIINAKEGAEQEKAMKAWKRDFKLALKRVKLATQACQDARSLSSSHTGGEARGKLAKLPSNLPTVVLSPSTTKKYLKVFLEGLERELNAEGTPKYQRVNNRQHCRWADALLRVFAPADTVAADWVDKNLVRKQPQDKWSVIKAKFIEKFTRAHDQFGGLRDLLPLPGVKGQGNETTATYLTEFERLVNESLQGKDPAAAWKHVHPVYTLLFIHGLRPALRVELVKDKRFNQKCAEGLTGIGELARLLEEEEASRQLLLQPRTPLTGKSPLKRAGRHSEFDGSPQKRAKSGGAELQRPTEKCGRCGRTHKGGAQQCWATRDSAGQPINSPATATRPERGQRRAPSDALASPITARCHKCRQVGHLRADCPNVKIARVTKPGQQGGGDRPPPGGSQIDMAQYETRNCFMCQGAHEYLDCPHLSKVKSMLSDQE